jgi:dihydropteroate synthase
MVWRCRQYTFSFPRPALVMGILNVTPDSFSDGGRFLDPSAAVDQAQRLVAEGADLVDIGGESTRPGAPEVEASEERRRVLPVVERLQAELRVPLSIDTRKPEVAAAAVEAGAALINDVEANRTDPEMWQVVARGNCGYVAMHMQGTPQTMQSAPSYSDVVGEVGLFLEERLDRLSDAGVGREQVILDPGIGFGKSLGHNLDLIAHLSQLGRLQRPILLGVSRKSFLGRLLGAEVPDRLPGALACTVWAALQGVQVFRTHDVGATVQALRTVEALTSARTRSA